MSLKYKCTKCKNIFDEDFEICSECGAKAFWHKVPVGTFSERKTYYSEIAKNKKIEIQKIIPPEIDQTLYFHCKKCDYYSNNDFGNCPQCGAKDFFWNIEVCGNKEKIKEYFKLCEQQRKEEIKIIAQNKYSKILTCPRCGNENAIVTPITETSGNISSKGVGCLGWLFWIVLAFFTFGIVLIIPLILSVRPKGRVTSKTYNRATCQKCGYWWKIY